MYTLQVYYRGHAAAALIEAVNNAADVTTRLPELLGQHPACARIAVHLEAAHLFSVDCNGDRLPD